MDDSKYIPSFDIIMNAGNAKSAALMAVDAAKDGDFEEAEKRLKEAKDEMREAHQKQFDLMQQEIAGTPVDMNIILVHAQDHLSMAMIAKDFAEQFVDLYRKLEQLK